MDKMPWEFDIVCETAIRMYSKSSFLWTEIAVAAQAQLAFAASKGIIHRNNSIAFSQSYNSRPGFFNYTTEFMAQNKRG
jgi:hypothetical protein